MDKKRFIVEGMSCSACENSVKKAVLRVDGVKDVNVSLLDKSMEVEFDEKADINKINKAVKKAGYKSYLDENGYEDNDNEVKIMAIRLISSFVLLIFLFYISMGHMMGWNIGVFKERLILLAVVECILALALMIINHKFFVSSFYAIKNRSLNMDVLVALGSSVSFIYGFVVMIIMIINKDSDSIVHISHNLTFETAGMVPTLITIGKFLEALSKKKTKNALKDLLDMSPKYANIIKDGKEIKVKIEEVVKGDIFIVKPGESVAVDGFVIEGYSTIDESMLSGESMPVDKKTGDLVYQATINQTGNIKCEALKVGNDTSFSKIIALVKEASSSKAKISRIVDKVASIFVPFIILISLIVFITWIIILNCSRS